MKEWRRLCARLIAAAFKHALLRSATSPPAARPDPSSVGGRHSNFALICHHLLFLTNSTLLPRHPAVTPSPPPPPPPNHSCRDLFLRHELFHPALLEHRIAPNSSAWLITSPHLTLILKCVAAALWMSWLLCEMVIKRRLVSPGASRRSSAPRPAQRNELHASHR